MQNVACDLETGDAHLQIGAIVSAKPPPPHHFGVFLILLGSGEIGGGGKIYFIRASSL